MKKALELKKSARIAGEKLIKDAVAKMTPAEQKKLRLAVRPRDTPFSLRFNSLDIAEWRRAAKAEEHSLTECVEAVLNAWAASRLGGRRAK